MIIVCPSCQAKYKFDEEKLGERPRAKTRCAKCGGTIEIENPLLGRHDASPGDDAAGTAAQVPTVEAPAPKRPTRAAGEEAGRARAGTVTGRGLEKSIARAAQGQAVLARGHPGPRHRPHPPGAEGAHDHRPLRARTSTSRTPRPRGSTRRWRSSATTPILRDLGSTNGTYVEADRIEQQVLNNQMEFRIGSHVLMFIVTDVDVAAAVMRMACAPLRSSRTSAARDTG